MGQSTVEANCVKSHFPHWHCVFIDSAPATLRYLFYPMKLQIDRKAIRMLPHATLPLAASKESA